jgi:DNA-binding XRE family transcriptional regulator
MAFDIAIKILDRLEQLGWSQKRLANELGVSPQLVNKWVRGKENFTIETLTKIGKTLNTSFIEIPFTSIEESATTFSFILNSNENIGLHATTLVLKKKLKHKPVDLHPSSKGFDTFNIAAEPPSEYASKKSKHPSQKKIEYLVSSITVHQSEIFDISNPEFNEVDVNLKINYTVLEDQQAIVCTLYYEVTETDHPLFRYKVSCTYSFNLNDWNAMMADQQFTLPSSLARQLGVVVGSITRGIIHIGLERTEYRSFSLPIIHPDELPEEDIIFKLK